MGNTVLSLEELRKIGFSAKKFEEGQELRIIHIPIILFKEISQVLGTGESREIYTRGGQYLLIELNSNHPNTGFQGAIGLQIDDRVLLKVKFVLWDSIPKGEPNNIFEPDYFVRILGQAREAGIWAYGKGNLLKEEITAELRFSQGIPLENPATKLVSCILYRAHLLTQEPYFRNYQFWESQL